LRNGHLGPGLLGHPGTLQDIRQESGGRGLEMGDDLARGGLIEGRVSRLIAVVAIGAILTDIVPQEPAILQGSAYSTASIQSPCGGTVGPDFERSRNSYSRSTSPTGSFPRPTSSRVPTILRTMWRRKDFPRTVKCSSSPVASRANW